MAAAGPRKAAMLSGQTRYFTGNPCCHGHIAERFVSTKACVVCALKSGKKWYAENPEVKGKIRQDWAKKNRDKVCETRRKYYAGNQAKVFSLNKRRKLIIQQRTPKWADLRAIDAIYVEAKARRDRGEDVVVDHIIPLQGEDVSGLHVHTNLQIIGRSENAQKSNKYIERKQDNGIHS